MKAATAVTHNARLNAFASSIAQRPVVVSCLADDEPESPWAHHAWAYVQRPLARQTIIHADARICAGAVGVEDETLPPWQRALAVLTLVHESYHLRHWRHANNEAKVECRAIQQWRARARQLGASEATTDKLWPIALAFHYQFANSRGFLDPKSRPYYDPGCVVPPLIDVEAAALSQPSTKAG